MSSRNASGSVRSPSDVDPTRSQNTTVTVLRTSAAGSTSNGDPHAEQNRAASAFSRPQEGQITPEASITQVRCTRADRRRPKCADLS